jgi:malate dehydrogenase (decarboxylating)
VIQFEDFSSDHARILLDRYRFSGITTFNDDIQGTQAAATAGLLGALRVKGQDASAIVQERIVVCGCGSAGLGVSNMLVKMLVRHGLSVEEAKSRLYMFDMEGLVTTARGDSVDGSILELARSEEATVRDKDDLLTVVKAAKPSVLIGLTGTGGMFTEEVIQAMNECNDRPIFMPMSNPTSRLECTHEDVRRICGQRAIYMSGSPQQDVVVDSKVMCASQANNIYIFPGLALGAFLSEGGVVTDSMVIAATESLPEMLEPEDSAMGRCYPKLDRIRDVSCHVACAVIKQAHADGNVVNPLLMRAIHRSAQVGDDMAITAYIQSHMWSPNYDSPLVHE